MFVELARALNLSGGRLNMNTYSNQYGNSHYKDKTVSRPSYRDNGNIHTRKDLIYLETGPSSIVFLYTGCCLPEATGEVPQQRRVGHKYLQRQLAM